MFAVRRSPRFSPGVSCCGSPRDLLRMTASADRAGKSAGEKFRNKASFHEGVESEVDVATALTRARQARLPSPWTGRGIRKGGIRKGERGKGTSSRFFLALLNTLLRALDDRLENLEPVVAAEHFFDRVLRMRHQAEHVEAIVGDARDRTHRAVGIRGLRLSAIRVDITQQHLPPVLHLTQFLFGRDVASLAMLDRKFQDFARTRGASEWCAGIIDPHRHVIADEGERAVTGERAGQQMRLAQDLKAVANPDYESALGGESRYALHDWREARDRAASKVVAVAEAAGEDDALRAAEAFVLMPKERSVLAEHVPQRMKRVVVVERAGKAYDTPPHPSSTSPTSKR